MAEEEKKKMRRRRRRKIRNSERKRAVVVSMGTELYFTDLVKYFEKQILSTISFIQLQVTFIK